MTPPATAAVARAPQRARSGLRAPRRLSGPARTPKAPRPRTAVARAGSPLLQVVAAAERLSSHRLIDRLVRGRAWLVLITCALIGVVTLQLALLKLNGGVGRTLQTQAQLQRENASLSIENSELAAADRVQTRAAQMGMEFTSSTALRSLAANPRLDVRRAASVLSAPVHSQTPSSEESKGPSTGGEGSTSGQASESSSPQAASTGESSATGEASSASGSGTEGGSGSTPSSAQGGEASASSQAGASESETATAAAGGQGAPESGSSG
jgi:cell division protein FtsL